MKRMFWLGILLTCSGLTYANPWQALYGDSIEFDVVREDDRIGSYTTNFDGDGSNLRVESRMELRVPIFLFWSYEYSYRASEIWRDGQLYTLEAEVNENGDDTRTSIERDGDHLVGEGPAGPIQLDPPILPTHHYNAAVVSAGRVFNTLTGRENQVRVEPVAREPVKVGDRVVEATRYRYSGDLSETEVWYDDQGRWLRLRFPGSDGLPIDFICRQCGYRTDS